MRSVGAEPGRDSRDEIVVVGASASGLLAALLLARDGRRVRVLERAEALHPTRRTLIVTDRMRDQLGGLGARAVVNEIRRFELHADGRVASVTLARPDLVIERATLIEELAGEAEAAGVKLDLGRRLAGLRPEANGLALETRTGGDLVDIVEATTVIGADGAGSRVAAAAGWPKPPLLPLLQAVVRLPGDVAPDTSRIWFKPEDTPFFYWLVPESDTVGVLGVIGTDAGVVRGRLDAFLQSQGLDPIAYQAARIPVLTQWEPVSKRLGAGEVFLVGDAAGHVKVTTVGGLVTGLRGAVAVANAILRDDGDRELRSLRYELRAHQLVRRALQSFGTADYANLLGLLDGRARGPLSRCSRDQAIGFMWRLSIAQPRLLLLLLRGLARSSSIRQRG